MRFLVCVDVQTRCVPSSSSWGRKLASDYWTRCLTPRQTNPARYCLLSHQTDRQTDLARYYLLSHQTDRQTDRPSKVLSLGTSDRQTDKPSKVLSLITSDIQTDKPSKVLSLVTPDIQTDKPIKVLSLFTVNMQTDNQQGIISFLRKRTDRHQQGIVSFLENSQTASKVQSVFTVTVQIPFGWTVRIHNPPSGIGLKSKCNETHRSLSSHTYVVQWVEIIEKN